QVGGGAPPVPVPVDPTASFSLRSLRRWARIAPSVSYNSSSAGVSMSCTGTPTRLPILSRYLPRPGCTISEPSAPVVAGDDHEATRSEEHTSELQSREKLVCRLLLEKK